MDKLCPYQMINLSNKIALITGASRGIGAATVIKFAEAGARGIVINYVRDRQAATKISNECKSLGVEAIAIRADVSRVSQARKLVRETVDRFPDELAGLRNPRDIGAN